MDDVPSDGAARTPLPMPAFRAVCARHGLPLPSRVPSPWVGATSCVYPVGDVVLKVPHPTPAAVEALRRDIAVAPLARGAGVTTPRVLAFETAGDLLPVPYAVCEQVRGNPLARPATATAVDEAAWRALGRQLALVHTRLDAEPLRPMLRSFVQSPEVDPRPWVDELSRTDRLFPDDARWLRTLLDRLAPAALAPLPLSFCHGDVNVANVLVRRDPPRLVLIDWSGAGWLDPVWDFVGVPLVAVPAMLAGHREGALLVDDATAEARLLWCHLQTALDRLLRLPAVSPTHTTRRLFRAVRAYLAATGAAGLSR